MDNTDLPQGNQDDMMEALLELARGESKSVKEEGFDKVKTNIFEKGVPPLHALGVTNDKKQEEDYAQAFHLYESGRFEDAFNMFSALLCAEPNESKYLFGYAACAHMMRDFKNAARAYCQLASYDAQDPSAYFHATDCYLQLQDPVAAMVTLRLAIKRSENKEEFAQIREQAVMTLEKIEAEIDFESINASTKEKE